MIWVHGRERIDVDEGGVEEGEVGVVLCSVSVESQVMYILRMMLRFDWAETASKIIRSRSENQSM